ALNTSVSIQGPGANQLTVEHDTASASYFAIFSVGNAATVQVSGMTLTRGTMGAVTNSGALTISDCNLSGNNNSYGSGGAISNTGALTISRSTLSGNQAYGSPGSDGDGGAVFMTSGMLSIDSSTLYGNYAQGGSGDPGSPDAPGGPS